MNVLVLGGTGSVGIAFITECLAKNHTVVVYARSPENLPDEVRNDSRVQVIQGTLSDADALLDALKDVDAVISALGPPVKSGPFYPSDTPLAKGYVLLIEQMRKSSVKRLIALGQCHPPCIPAQNCLTMICQALQVTRMATTDSQQSFGHSSTVWPFSLRNAYKDVVSTRR